MAQREICMGPCEGSSRFPPGPRDKFPFEACSESLVLLVPASPTPVQAYGVVAPLSSQVPLVLEEARGTGPSVPVVP
ncbi:hypothetical protein KY289_023999 [Solanum tuberosum]|nr:hypothetical protein KY289_023999 [Solanum tuberosum]